MKGVSVKKNIENIWLCNMNHILSMCNWVVCWPHKKSWASLAITVCQSESKIQLPQSLCNIYAMVITTSTLKILSAWMRGGPLTWVFYIESPCLSFQHFSPSNTSIKWPMVSESRASSSSWDFCLLFLFCAVVRVSLLRVFSHAGIRWRLYKMRRQRVCFLDAWAASMHLWKARRKFSIW